MKTRMTRGSGRRSVLFLCLLIGISFMCTSHQAEAALGQRDTYASLVSGFLSERSSGPPLPISLPIPIFQIESDILAGDYAFQTRDDWYYHNDFGGFTYATGGEIGLSHSEGDRLALYDNLETGMIEVTDEAGNLLATVAAEAWPVGSEAGGGNTAAFTSEVERRSILGWATLQNSGPPPGSPPSGYQGGAPSGGYNPVNELQITELSVNALDLTFGFPASLNGFFDIYKFDPDLAGVPYTQHEGYWEQVATGLTATNSGLSINWPLVPSSAKQEYYTVGVANADTDGDGYSDAYEIFILGTDPDDADTDGDGVSDGPLDPDNTGSIVMGPDLFPSDPAAWEDTDMDGMPDTLSGASSTGLIEDTDDDNDGYLDTVETTGIDAIYPTLTAPFKTVNVESMPDAGSVSPYSSMTVAGDQFQHPWNAGLNNMKLVDDNLWEYAYYFDTTSDLNFKFVADGDWSNPNWGDNQPDGTADLSGADIVLSGPLHGYYRFSFNDSTLFYSVTPASARSFDVSTAGRMLPYAAGSDASGGYGNVHGGIYFNHDSSTGHLYVGVAGFEKGTDPNVLLIFLDTDGTSGGVTSLSGLSGNPLMLGTADNLNFGAGFTPNVAILVGSRDVEGKNDPNWSGSGTEARGQGVYELSAGSIAHFPGFSLTAGALCQWGDRNADSANGGIEVALSMSDLGLNTGDRFTAAAIIAGGPSGANRHYSTEAYGDSASGFGTAATTLNGSDIYLSPVHAPSFAGPPPFTEDDVMLQMYTWDVPYDTANTNGTWYDHLQGQALSNEFSRFTMGWMPPPQKSDSGINSVGYDPFDYYDLGTYLEKFTRETRYGSEAELLDCNRVLKQKGVLPMIDLVLNHNQGGYGPSIYNFPYGNHNTFEKLDPGGNNGNLYFNSDGTANPFHGDHGFGVDVNHAHPYQRIGLKNWGCWVTAKAGYGAYRWDLTYAIDPWFISEFMRYEIMNGTFSVLEYWEKDDQATVQEYNTWLALTDYTSAMFDMKLHKELADMCENPGIDYDMTRLTREGLVNHFPEWAVTFVESHDTIRPYASGSPKKSGISKDKPMAYAFILVAGQGLPMVPYNDYIIGWQTDENPPDDAIDDGWTGPTLKPEIDELIDVRQLYAGGGVTYLHADSNLLIVQRNGHAEKPGCILTLNDHDSSTLSTSVSVSHTNGTILVDVLDTNHTATVSGGTVTLEGPSRGYRVYVNQDDL